MGVVGRVRWNTARTGRRLGIAAIQLQPEGAASEQRLMPTDGVGQGKYCTGAVAGMREGGFQSSSGDDDGANFSAFYVMKAR